MSSRPKNIAFGDLFKLSSNTSPALKSMLQGKIVFVGAESIPPGHVFSSVEGPLYDVRIHAEALAAALRNKEIIWIRSPWFLVFLELAALSVLYLVQHWIRRPRWRIAVIFIGAILLSALLSTMAFATPIFLFNFLPLLGGVFIDLLLAKPRSTAAVFPGKSNQQPVPERDARFAFFPRSWRSKGAMNLFRGLALPSLLLFVLLLLVSADSIWALNPSQPMSSYIRDRIGEQEGRCLGHSTFPVLKSSEPYAVN